MESELDEPTRRVVEDLRREIRQLQNAYTALGVTEIQFGRDNPTLDGNGEASVTFDNEFSTTPRMVASLAASQMTGDVSVNVISISTTGFSYRIYYNDSPASGNRTIEWVALA